MHVAARRVIVAEHLHRLDDLDAGRVLRNEDLRLLLARRRVRIGLHHHDHDLAARIAGAGDIVLLAVDHILVADELCRGRDVLGVRRSDVRLGHHVGGANFAVEQRLQPLLLLLLGADPLQHLHVAGIRRRAIHGLRRHRALAEFGGDVGVIEVLQPLAGLRVRQEEVPQAFRLRLVLGLLQQLELAGRKAPAVGLVPAEPHELGGHRIDRLLDELADMIVERPHLVGHAQVVHFHHRGSARSSCRRGVWAICMFMCFSLGLLGVPDGAILRNAAPGTRTAALDAISPGDTATKIS